jgi:hypothetical protein
MKNQKLKKVTKNLDNISDNHMFVLNEAENEHKSSKNSKRHEEDESENEETGQK